jgi:hypothetical protein
MKTLLERLKPEHKAKLDVEAEKYPAMARSIMQELKTKHVILDLSYGCVATMSNMLLLDNLNIDTIMDLFDNNWEALKVKAEELLKVKI